MKPESFSPWSVHYRGHTRQTGALWVKCWGYGSLWFLFFFFFKLTFKHSFLLLCSFNQLSKSNTCKPLSFTNIQTCSHFHFQFFQLPSFLFHSQLVFCFFFFLPFLRIYSSTFVDSIHSALTELRNLDESDHLPVISGQQKQRNGDGLFDVLTGEGNRA